MAKRRRSRSTVRINKYHVGSAFIILGFLFFFSKILAPEAPVFKFLSDYASIAFGELGLGVFFFLCVLVGVGILIKGYLMKTLLKQFVILMFLVSAIVNFPAFLKTEGELINWVASAKYGGYFSWPVFK
ncbi:MAG: hypothetical protein LBI53_02405 [Candidatus Peribacteria bacterium]|nr:hypothetical protein [Candidatus Peribacteria bacterium]